jgi:hypothetical protein
VLRGGSNSLAVTSYVSGAFGWDPVEARLVNCACFNGRGGTV